MLFNSWAFVVLLLPVALLFFLAGRYTRSWQLQSALLCLASFVFYGHGQAQLVLLLLFSLTMNIGFAALLVRHTGRRQRALVGMGVAANLSLLAVFKYGALLAESFLPISWQQALPVDPTSIPLPIGISFYTFQAITLLVDICRREDPGLDTVRDMLLRGQWAQAALKIALYIAFFPQLVAGPIVRAGQFLGQIGHKVFADIDFNRVTTYLVTGFFLKMVVADNLKEVTGLLGTVDFATMAKLDLILTLYAYSFQIFADFAGYSAIAIGLGALFGYTLPTNFNSPYLAQSITEFWRRWHITLSAFLKNYLYIPLGGNRASAYRTYLNLMIVMALGGLWHGAAWSYAIWGGAHGLLLVIERFMRNRRAQQPDGASSSQSPAFKLLNSLVRILITFHLVSLLWLLFLMPDFSRVLAYLHAVWHQPVGLNSLQNAYIVCLFSLPVVLLHANAFLAHRLAGSPRQAFFLRTLPALTLPLQLFLILTNSGSSGAFIYFQF